MTPLLIGLSGGSCAGKTTLARLIKDRLAPIPTAIINTDRYYRPLDHLPIEKRTLENFDSPEMLERELLRSHLTLLKSGKPAGLPVYDFRLHTRSPENELLDPPPVILVEGLFVLTDPGIRPLFDLAVFVETPSDIRLARRILRDQAERGRTPEETIKRYFSQIRPGHEKFAQPGQEIADLVLAGENNPEEAADLVVAHISKLLSAGVVSDSKERGLSPRHHQYFDEKL
jgi:uridine kinase